MKRSKLVQFKSIAVYNMRSFTQTQLSCLHRSYKVTMAMKVLNDKKLCPNTIQHKVIWHGEVLCYNIVDTLCYMAW